ncbi:MAG: CooT family nickel-binding protein [Candidatus Thermoplasmatota archaeon]|nr:CooT family nickel-binding protein [Candidatus Thermoplasmatota archaeon]
MCESAVYLIKGSEKLLVMPEAARLLVSGSDITCVDTLGDLKTVKDVELAEANLVKHEIILRPRTA